MKTEPKLNNEIMKITTTIAEKFPDLMKYLGEMPVKVSDTAGNESDIKNLYDYYGSLDALVKGYVTGYNL